MPTPMHDHGSGVRPAHYGTPVQRQSTVLVPVPDYYAEPAPPPKARGGRPKGSKSTKVDLSQWQEDTDAPPDSA